MSKTDYDTKIVETEKKTDQDCDHSNKYTTTEEFNNFIANKFEAKLKQVNLVTKAEIFDFGKKKDFDDKLKNINRKLTLSKTKHVMIENGFQK